MIRAILTDIEGTTTSVSFVYEVLFPYARAHIAGYVRGNADEPAVRAELAAVAAEIGQPLGDEQAIAQLLEWIDQDRKVTPLKGLQGMLWEKGYLDGDFTGHVYADAARRLREWKVAGLRLYVYSSGSVKAQRLLFGHSDQGDLLPLFSGYFDTWIGSKREADSYRRICEEIGLPAAEILFLSDIVEELDAAKAAGMETYHLVRDGAVVVESCHRRVSDFDQITLEGHSG